MQSMKDGQIKRRRKVEKNINPRLVINANLCANVIRFLQMFCHSVIQNIERLFIVKMISTKTLAHSCVNLLIYFLF